MAEPLYERLCFEDGRKPLATNHWWVPAPAPGDHIHGQGGWSGFKLWCSRGVERVCVREAGVLGAGEAHDAGEGGGGV